MLKTIIAAAALAGAATAALAQNDMVPMVGPGAAGKVKKTVNFTALGSYAGQGEKRLIDVRLDADADGDGANDEGVLHVTCNGGDILTGQFAAGQKLAAVQPKLKVAKAPGSSAIAAGKSFKASWILSEAAKARAIGDPVPLSVPAGDTDVCA